MWVSGQCARLVLFCDVQTLIDNNSRVCCKLCEEYFFSSTGKLLVMCACEHTTWAVAACNYAAPENFQSKNVWPCIVNDWWYFQSWHETHFLNMIQYTLVYKQVNWCEKTERSDDYVHPFLCWFSLACNFKYLNRAFWHITWTPYWGILAAKTLRMYCTVQPLL